MSAAVCSQCTRFIDCDDDPDAVEFEHMGKTLNFVCERCREALEEQQDQVDAL